MKRSPRGRSIAIFDDRSTVRGRAALRMAASLLVAYSVWFGGANYARAQTEADVANVERLFEKAAALLDAKSYAEACPLLEEVVRLAPDALGGKLSLAECYEGSGRLASAWSTYSAVERIAAEQGTAQADRRKVAAAKVAELGPRLATLTITVDEKTRKAPDFEVLRDGMPVTPEQWGQAIPVDPGHYVLIARAKGKRPFEKRVEVAANGEKIALVIPVLEAKVLSLAPPPPVVVTPPERGSMQGPVGLGLIGVGLVGLGLSGVFSGMAAGKNTESKQDGYCNANNLCTPEGLALRNDAVLFADVATGMLIAGGAVAAGGLVVFLTRPKKGARPLTANVSVTPGFVSVHGRF